MSFHDWSINEMFAPIWLDPGTCVCIEGVAIPEEASASIQLIQSKAFGTGGHPITRAALGAFRRIRTAYMGNAARVLDFHAGTGVLSFYAKTMASADKVIACVDPGDHDTIMANERFNGHLDDVLMPGTMCSFTESEFYADFFDIVITQGGCLDMLPRLEFLEKITNRAGTLIFAGHPPANHRVIVHRVSEYFEILDVNDFAGWPVIIAEPFSRKPTKLP